MSLVKAGAAKILTEKRLNHESLINQVDQLMNQPKILQKMGQNSKRLGVPDSADRLLKIMDSLIRHSVK